MNIRHSFKYLGSLLTLAGVLLVANTTQAAPGTIANEPLQTSASAPPNILFHVDTSGSMGMIVPEYDSSSYSYSCTSQALPAGAHVELRVSSGVPKIRYSGSNYDFGDSSGEKCFDPSATYDGLLSINCSGSSYCGTGIPYTGDYLNWYFDTSTDSGAATWSQGYKPGSHTRIDVAKTSLTDLVDTLNNVNVGLSSFDGNNGAQIDVPVADITSNRATMDSTISTLVHGGGTPLAESLRDIGRYFSNNQSNGECGGASGTDLTIHPDEALTTDTPPGRREDLSCTDLLDNRINTTTNGPINYFCQKNFVIMMTDGVPTVDNNLDDHLKDYDGDCTTAAETAGGYTCDSSNDTKSYDPGPDYDYWDDVAQAMYEIDLRPDMNDAAGNAVKNNLITYTVGFADEAVKNLSLIRDTAAQGGGEFLFAENSAQLRRSFEAATKSIIAQSSTSSAVTFNSSTLSSQSAVYQALFNTVRWSGELRSIPLDGFSGAVLTNCTAGTNNCWAASDQIDGQSASSRTILTYNPTQNAGVAFQSPADYTAPTTDEVPQGLVDDLCAGPNIPHACDATTAADSTLKGENQSYIDDLVAYLRGDRSNEGTGRDFRVRTSVLGDLVNASPVYVGKPASGWPNRAPFPEPPTTAGDPDNTYSTWINTSVKNRDKIVYAASNDGMLHGFRTTESSSGAGDAGNEVFAFVPTGTFGTNNNDGLHYLADPTYSHIYYNDLTPTIADVYMKHRDTASGAITSSEEWRTMLIGGQRAGGRSLYMLDVTDPSAFSETNAKELVEWEFTHPDLGYSFSKPTIAMMNNGKFAAIFGNGYKSGEDGGTGDCHAKLFVVFLEGGLDGTWTAGTDYQVYDTNVGDTTNCNGLSTPAVVDLDRDGTADRVYAGDLAGNLWAFDLCNWDSTNSVCQTSGWGLANASPIMTANDGASPTANPQPITVKPVVSLDPASAGADDLLIVFGTGQYITNNDKTDTTQQTMYGVRDYDALTNGRSSWGLNPRLNSAQFIDQTINETDCAGVVTNCTGILRSIDTPEATMSSNKNGWMIDLPTSGERVVVNPKIRNNIVFFNTLIPSNTVCSAGGSGWLMSVNLQNGGIPLVPVWDINNDGVIDGTDVMNGDPPIGEKSDAIPAESTFLGDKQYTPDSMGNINVRNVNIGKTAREGRMSWRELYAD